MNRLFSMSLSLLMAYFCRFSLTVLPIGGEAQGRAILWAGNEGFHETLTSMGDVNCG